MLLETFRSKIRALASSRKRSIEQSLRREGLFNCDLRGETRLNSLGSPARPEFPCKRRLQTARVRTMNARRDEQRDNEINPR